MLSKTQFMFQSRLFSMSPQYTTYDSPPKNREDVVPSPVCFQPPSSSLPSSNSASLTPRGHRKGCSHGPRASARTATPCPDPPPPWSAWRLPTARRSSHRRDPMGLGPPTPRKCNPKSRQSPNMEKKRGIMAPVGGWRQGKKIK